VQETKKPKVELEEDEDVVVTKMETEATPVVVEPKKEKTKPTPTPTAPTPTPTERAPHPTNDPQLAKDQFGDALPSLFTPGLLNTPIPTVEDKWKLVPAFLSLRGLVRQHIESFNFFIDTEMTEILAANNIVRPDSDPTVYCKYLRIYVGTPIVEENLVQRAATPHQCRLRDITYAAPIHVDLEYTRGKQLVDRKGVVIGRMPIMLRSNKCVLANRTDDELVSFGECPIDPGGYFIVRGQERVVLIQEQLSKNRILLSREARGNVQASVTSSTHERKSRCMVIAKGARGALVLKHNTLTEEIPLVIFFRAMGVVSDLAIANLVGTDGESLRDGLVESFREAGKLGHFTETQALDFIGQKMRTRDTRRVVRYRTRSKVDEARDLLAYVILSHVPVERFDFSQKISYVALLARHVLMARTDDAMLDDKDYYGNKRLELAGGMIAVLFEDLLKKFNADLKKAAENSLEKASHRTTQFDFVKLMRPDTISYGLSHALSTGNWTLRRFRMDRSGVTTVLSRLSFISALGMMTRITSQVEKTRKTSGPRALQPSQWGMLCPSDTPEGESCGLVKNLALTTHVTTDAQLEPVQRLCMDLGVSDLTTLQGSTVVVLNGSLIGSHSNAERFVTEFRLLRRRGFIDEFVSIHSNERHNAVYISADGGRLCRPLIVVDAATGACLLKESHVRALVAGGYCFEDLVKLGVVEYLDVNEENDANIALYEDRIKPGFTTHLEIAPFTILGVCAGLIPFPDHNQSPRNTYQSAMGKQSMGIIGLNHHIRLDTLLYSLVYPFRPLVSTKALDLYNFNDLPAGINACVAVMSYSGYDIEDALIVNRASVDRGFGRCVVHRKYPCVMKRYPNATADRLAPPNRPPPGNAPDPKQVDRYNHSFAQRHESLDRDGLASVGDMLHHGDVYVNKEVPLSTMDLNGDDIAYRRAEAVYRGPETVMVDKVLLTSSEDEHRIIKMSLRATRTPEVGDKFSSRHGQKGVVGMLVEQHDVPFSESGVCPDIIMNPHGFPSRMTVANLMELVASKAATVDGKIRDGTAFSGDKPKDLGDALISAGFSYGGKDFLTSGLTGEPISAYIFFGPVYYQKLKHMVRDKMHARARGPRAVLTRQPTEGRSREGGLRLGEMERDCLISYGASLLLVERLMLSSDVFQVKVCGECGLMGWQKDSCHSCGNSRDVSELQLPYACKLLFQELQSMNVMPRIGVK
jgi:DNA-directed RNA polymerase III subunit RPC2